MRKRPPVPSSLPQPITQLPPTTPLFLIPLSLIIPVTPRSAGPAWRRKADRSLRYAVSVTGMRDTGGGSFHLTREKRKEREMNRLHSSLHCRPSPAPCFACRVSDDVSDECKERRKSDTGGKGRHEMRGFLRPSTSLVTASRVSPFPPISSLYSLLTVATLRERYEV